MSDGRPGVAACLFDGALRVVGLVITGMLGICLAVPLAGSLAGTETDQQSNQAIRTHPCASAASRCTGTIVTADAGPDITFHWVPLAGAVGQTVLTTAASVPESLEARYNTLLVEPRDQGEVAADLDTVRTAFGLDRVMLYDGPAGAPGIRAYADRYPNQVIGVIE